MKLTVTKDELREKLGLLQNIPSKSEGMPVLTHILFSADEKCVRLAATDLAVSLRCPLDAKVLTAGSVCVPAKKITEIVKEAEGEITLEESKGWLTVKYGGKSSFRLACIEAASFPAWPAVETGVSFTMPAGDLAGMLDTTLYAAGDGDQRYMLNGVLLHLRLDEKKVIMVATDGHRLAVTSKTCEMSGSGQTKSILPRKGAAELKKVLTSSSEGAVECKAGPNQISFSLAGVEFVARLTEGTYPDYEKVIPASPPKVVHVEREALLKAIRKTAIFSSKEKGGLAVEIGDSTFSLSASSPDLGEAHDEIPAEYSGEMVRVGFNHRYLTDAVSAFASEKVALSFTDELMPFLLSNNGDRDCLAVVMPMRL